MTDEKGFTLVEIMVAVVILGVGMAAALSIQWNSLQGYTEAKGTAFATHMSQRIVEIVRAETQQWGEGTTNEKITDAVAAPLYSNGEWNVNSTTGLLDNVGVDLSGTPSSSWQALMSNPVNVRISDSAHRRYCAYGQGTQSEGTSLVYQVAVVFPRASEEFGGTCTPGNVIGNLDPSSPNNLEIHGYRAVYSATILTRRDY